jgi:hypothetical protein
MLGFWTFSKAFPDIVITGHFYEIDVAAIYDRKCLTQL